MAPDVRDGRLAHWGSILQRYGVQLLSLVVLIIYVPSLSGGYLPYDDDWLIEANPLLQAPIGEALRAFFLDFSVATRITLGAEYLPVRDVSHWCEVAVFGKSAFGMRVVQLLLYLASLAFLWGAFRRRIGNGALTWITVCCFALHPTHVESVAWLAGRKDVLALLFVCGALYFYCGQGRSRWCVVPLVVLAALSKSMSVIAPGLFLAMDLLGRRRPAWAVLVSSLLGVATVFALHLKVGGIVGMVGGPLGDSRLVAFWTMGDVWLRYLRALIDPTSLSVIYDVTAVSSPTVTSLLGWFVAVLSLGGALGQAAKARTAALGIALWAWLPLLPVSQVLFPLQNVMADRYLWLTSVALGLLLGFSWRGNRAVRVVVVSSLVAFAVGSAQRAALFGDAVALFEDAAAKSPGPRAPYQKGYALQQRGQVELAILAYREALSRPCTDCSAQRRAANNLAVLLVGRNEPQLAEPVLRRNVAQFPDDPKALFNLVKVLNRLGKEQEARRLFEAGRARFPTYSSSSSTPESARHPRQ